ncbi:MAG: hypothetical protein M1826_006193 [Phylliscum demangeonii]|nr:MAG: hypothetical protein M1826_006193 [Phylliscum demangeonii]
MALEEQNDGSSCARSATLAATSTRWKTQPGAGGKPATRYRENCTEKTVGWKYPPEKLHAFRQGRMNKGVKREDDKDPLQAILRGVRKNTGKSSSDADVDERRFAGFEFFGKIDAEQAKAEKAKAEEAKVVQSLDDVGSENPYGIEGTVWVLLADELLAPELARVGQDRH